MSEPTVQLDGGAIVGVQLVAVFIAPVPADPDLPLGTGKPVRPLDEADIPIFQDGVDAGRIRAKQLN